MTIPNQYEDKFTWNVMERNCKCQLMFADLQDLVRYHSVAGREWSNIPTGTSDSAEGDLKDV